MPRPTKSRTRKEEVYFDRLLAKVIGKYYPEFKQGIVPEEFKNKVLVDKHRTPLIHFHGTLKKLGIEQQDIAYWTIIDKEDWNYFRLIYDVLPTHMKYIFFGKDIGPLLLNEIRDFNL